MLRAETAVLAPAVAFLVGEGKRSSANCVELDRARSPTMDHEPMDARFLAQPFKTQSNAHEFLTNALSDPDIDHFLMLVAWVRSSGIDRLSGGLEGLRRRGGVAEAFIG